MRSFLNKIRIYIDFHYVGSGGVYSLFPAVFWSGVFEDL